MSGLNNAPPKTPNLSPITVANADDTDNLAVFKDALSPEKTDDSSNLSHPNKEGLSVSISHEGKDSSISAVSVLSEGKESEGKESLRKMQSRAQIVRQTSASLLRASITPSLLRNTSEANIFGELEENEQITLFYATGWDTPCIHFTSSSSPGIWTTTPGLRMSQATEAQRRRIGALLKNVKTQLWVLDIPGVHDLEFVPNNNGSGWDKPPSGGNYHIHNSGWYLLHNGSLEVFCLPPDKPALLTTKTVTASSVVLLWNPPITRVSEVAGYSILRDNQVIGTVGESTFEFEDRGLIGLTKYIYVVKAINRNGEAGPPTDTLEVSTGEPGKPSEVQNLRVASHSSECIELLWQKPSDNGGGMFDTYRIYRNGYPVGLKPYTSSDWESWKDTKVTPNTSYIYHITACRFIPPSQKRFDRNMTLSKLPSLLPETVPETIDIKVLTEFLARGIHHREFEGRVSEGVEGKAVTQLSMPRIGDRTSHIILQGFNWDSCKSDPKLYDSLKKKVGLMKDAKITMIWLPPPTASVAPQGYMPTRWHDLSSSYGSESSLREFLQCLRSNAVVPMLDFVANHRCGVKQDCKGQWTVFEDPDWGAWAIVSNNIVGYEGRGAADTGASSECAPDLDHTNKQIREDSKKWINWLFNDVGFGAIRIDMAPGYAAKYQVEYVESLKSPFAVGEYWSGDVNALLNYTKACKGLVAAYDFALYYILRRSVESGNFSELSVGGKLPGLIGKDPQRAVTFIDNHDTVHLNFVGKFAGWNKDAVLRGCVYLLTHPGVPCLYNDHFFDFGEKFGEQLRTLCRLRHQCEINSGSGVHIAAAHDGLYAAYVSKDRYCNPGSSSLAVKLGSQNWSPQEKGWTVKASGNDFCVWTR